MEKLINPLQGEFGDFHVKQGIIARRVGTGDIGFVSKTAKGYSIIDPMYTQHIGTETTINMLMIRFMNSYNFYLL